MIVAFTEHRPDKLPNKETGYKLPNPTYIHVCCEIEKTLIELKPEKVISGMALGVDQWAAFIAYKLNIPFLAAVPFEGQDSAWPEKSKKIYQKLLHVAAEIVIVSPGGYSAQKMQNRNEFMCNMCDKLIAIYNEDNNGGTFNCIEYAKSIHKEIIFINPNV